MTINNAPQGFAEALDAFMAEERPDLTVEERAARVAQATRELYDVRPVKIDDKEI